MAKEEIKYALTKGQQLHYIPNSLEKLQGKKGCTYTIEKVLGQGGYGITYLASTKIEQGHTKHKIFYAIKEFFPQRDCSRDEGSSFMKLPEADMAKKDVMTWLDEFEQEAKRLNNVCNKIPHVVKVNEVFRENNTAYYVMEYLNGGSLKDAIDENGMPERKALGILIPIAKTVALLHEQRIIHCDIKDGNIMMNKKDDGSLEPVLIDFGESRHLNADGSLTSKRIFAGGTPGYAPEEQLAGIITEQVDVYALAATLFKMLTGANPQVQSSMTEEYIDKKLPDYISAQTRTAIKHALKHRREDRTNSVRLFAEELEGFIPNELPEGFIITHGTENYQIISVQEITSYYIRYKVNVTRSVQVAHDGLTRLRVIHGRDLYELFDIKNHKRNNDETLLTTGDISASKLHFLNICKKISKGEISRQFYEGSNLGWVSFASNNTLYIVDNHYRRPLPWKHILTYGGLGLGSVLLVIGAINIYNGIKKEKWEMSQKLTNAIITNNADSLRIFAEDYDSARAYLPYALICYNNGDFDMAERFANDSLRAIIKQKRDSIAQVAQQNAQEQKFDSLFNAAKEQYHSGQYDIAKEMFDSLLNVAQSQYENGRLDEAKVTLNKIDGEYSSRQEVRELGSKIENGLKEKIYADYLIKAKTAYNKKKYSEALSYITKIKKELGQAYSSKKEVRDLEKMINNIIPSTNDELFAKAKTISDYRALADKGYSKAYAPLAELYLNQAASQTDYDNAHQYATKAINANVGKKQAIKVVERLEKKGYYEFGIHSKPNY